jgi:hypothetical protein
MDDIKKCPHGAQVYGNLCQGPRAEIGEAVCWRCSKRYARDVLSGAAEPITGASPPYKILESW